MKEPSFYPLIFAIWFLPFSAIPQSNTIDSLKNALNDAKHDTTRVNILLQIVENIYDDNVWPEYNRQALDIAEKNITRSKGAVKLTFKKAKAAVLNNIGYFHDVQGNPDKALEYCLQSLEIRKEINDNQGIAQSLNNIGAIYDNKDNPDKALEYFLQSLEIWKEIDYKQGIAYSLNNIGLVYLERKDYAAATDYCTHSLRVAEELGYPENIMIAAGNLHKIYKAMAKRDRKRGLWEYGEHYAKAIEYNELYT